MEILKKILRVIKKFLKFILLEAGKAFFKLIVLGAIIFGISKYIKEEQELPPILKNTYIEIEMPNFLHESKIKTFLDIKHEDNFYDFLKEFDKIKEDKRVKGIILKLNNYGLDRAQNEELKIKIRELKKEGKIIYAYLDYINNRNYSLALEARDIIVPDTNFLISEISGYNGNFPYYKNLADKIGVEAEVIHIGDYKSFGENYTKSKMSEEFKENTKRILDKFYENYVGDISRKRRLNKKEISKKILDGDFLMASSYELIKNKFVDKALYYKDFLNENEIKKPILMKDYLERYNQEKSHEKKEKKNKIALLYLEGEIILNEDEGKIERVITPKYVEEKLEIAKEDKNIKGLVIRINSPGGSALASDLIYKSLKEFKKPVYISMGGVAASGGYFISAAGNKLYADKETITGSIGVVTIIPNASKLLGKIGINYEKIANTNYNTDMGFYGKLSPEMRDKIYNSSLSSYNEFLKKMSTSRKMKIADMEKLASGRVWTGSEAKEVGLIDEIGGVEKAIKDLALELKLEDYQVVEAVKKAKIQSLLSSLLPGYIFRDLMGENILTRELSKMKETALKEELLGRPILYAPDVKF